MSAGSWADQVTRGVCRFVSEVESDSKGEQCVRERGKIEQGDVYEW